MKQQTIFLLFISISSFFIIVFLIIKHLRGNKKCYQSCEGCSKDFDIDKMQTDSDGVWLCNDCYTMLLEEVKTWVCTGCGVTGLEIEWCGDNYCQNCDDKDSIAHNARVRNYKQHQIIYFINDALPHEIKALADRYAVCVRELNYSHDYDLLKFRVDMQAYSSIDEAYKKLKDEPVYSLVDFWERKRGADNYGCKFDYKTQQGCDEAILELISGEVELSRRNMTDLRIDDSRTNYANLKTPKEDR